MEFLIACHLDGLIIGICTFLIIGFFHPVVVKAEYYWGTRCWWIFLILGVAGVLGSLLWKTCCSLHCWAFFLFLRFGQLRNCLNSVSVC